MKVKPTVAAEIFWSLFDSNALLYKSDFIRNFFPTRTLHSSFLLKLGKLCI